MGKSGNKKKNKARESIFQKVGNSVESGVKGVKSLFGLNNSESDESEDVQMADDSVNVYIDASEQGAANDFTKVEPKRGTGQKN